MKIKAAIFYPPFLKGGAGPANVKSLGVSLFFRDNELYCSNF